MQISSNKTKYCYDINHRAVRKVYQKYKINIKK